MRSCLLSARQGRKELSDYVQELRILINAMQLDPSPEMVLVTIIVEGLRAGTTRTKYSKYTTPRLRRLLMLR